MKTYKKVALVFAVIFLVGWSAFATMVAIIRVEQMNATPTPVPAVEVTMRDLLNRFGGGGLLKAELVSVTEEPNEYVIELIHDGILYQTELNTMGVMDEIQDKVGQVGYFMPLSTKICFATGGAVTTLDGQLKGDHGILLDPEMLNGQEVTGENWPLCGPYRLVLAETDELSATTIVTGVFARDFDSYQMSWVPSTDWILGWGTSKIWHYEFSQLFLGGGPNDPEGIAAVENLYAKFFNTGLFAGYVGPVEACLEITNNWGLVWTESLTDEVDRLCGLTFEQRYQLEVLLPVEEERHALSNSNGLMVAWGRYAPWGVRDALACDQPAAYSWSNITVTVEMTKALEGYCDDGDIGVNLTVTEDGKIVLEKYFEPYWGSYLVFGDYEYAQRGIESSREFVLQLGYVQQ